MRAEGFKEHTVAVRIPLTCLDHLKKHKFPSNDLDITVGPLPCFLLFTVHDTFFSLYF